MQAGTRPCVEIEPNLRPPPLLHPFQLPPLLQASTLHYLRQVRRKSLSTTKRVQSGPPLQRIKAAFGASFPFLSSLFLDRDICFSHLPRLVYQITLYHSTYLDLYLLDQHEHYHLYRRKRSLAKDWLRRNGCALLSLCAPNPSRSLTSYPDLDRSLRNVRRTRNRRRR